MKKFLFIFLLTFLAASSFSQTNPTDNFVSWSSTRKLTINDFAIKTSDKKSAPSFSQFSIEFQVGGFDFMTRNFNKKVHNYFIKSASWIDTTFDKKQSIRYEQTLFDISEVYTRRFRKELKMNRKKIASGTSFLKKLNAQIMSDFTKRRMEYDTETLSGSDINKQEFWEAQIQNELEELKDFSAE